MKQLVGFIKLYFIFLPYGLLFMVALLGIYSLISWTLPNIQLILFLIRLGFTLPFVLVLIIYVLCLLHG